MANNEEWAECTDVEAKSAKQSQATDADGNWFDVGFNGPVAYRIGGTSLNHRVGRKWRKRVFSPVYSDLATIAIPEGATHIVFTKEIK